MCNLYGLTKDQAAIREVARAMVDRTGNWPSMPVILTTLDELEAWMTAPTSVVPAMQHPLPDGALRVVTRGEKRGGPKAA